MSPQLRNTGAPVLHALRRVNEQLDDMPKHGMICAVHLMGDPWTFQDGLLTPTFKIKRKVVEGRFHDEIAVLYTQLGQSAQRTSSTERGISTDI